MEPASMSHRSRESNCIISRQLHSVIHNQHVPEKKNTSQTDSYARIDKICFV